jgi:hypothetical protein
MYKTDRRRDPAPDNMSRHFSVRVLVLYDGYVAPYSCGWPVWTKRANRIPKTLYPEFALCPCEEFAVCRRGRRKRLTIRETDGTVADRLIGSVAFRLKRLAYDMCPLHTRSMGLTWYINFFPHRRAPRAKDRSPGTNGMNSFARHCGMAALRIASRLLPVPLPATTPVRMTDDCTGHLSCVLFARRLRSKTCCALCTV